MAKYEFKIVSAHEDYIGTHVKKAYKEGWVPAGEASTQYHGSPTSAVYIYIPFKRKIKRRFFLK
jgi:hypothetical protein